MKCRSLLMPSALVIALWVVAFSVGITGASAVADSVYVRNPFDSGATITNAWNHPSLATPPYSERALDTVRSSGATSGASVISHVDNVNVGKSIVYDSFDYGTDYDGVKHVMYEWDGVNNPVYVGTVVYLHLAGHTTSWYGVSSRRVRLSIA